jgi:hypothetical protein
MGLVHTLIQIRAALITATALATDSETKATLRLQKAEIDLLLEKHNLAS